MSAHVSTEAEMIKVSLTFPAHIKTPTLTRLEMLKIGAKAIEVIQKRLKRAEGVRDNTMKPLGNRYAQKKGGIGQPPIRNLMFSGAMQGAMDIVSAETNKVTIGFTRRTELVKAEANQRRDPWYGLSPNDQQLVEQFATRLIRKR